MHASPMALQGKKKGPVLSGKVVENEPAKPSGKKVEYKNDKKLITCCRHAFSVTKECKYAFCSACVKIKMVGASEGGKRKRGATSADVSKGGEVSNDKCCRGEHRLQMLDVMDDKKYLKKNRNEKKLEWVAETCWKCGDEF